jgi:hypothetical protein
MIGLLPSLLMGIGALLKFGLKFAEIFMIFDGLSAIIYEFI